MRMFLAVDLRATLGEAAHDWGRAVAAAIGPRDAAALSWVPASRIHVTLHFFGALEPEAVAALPARLGGAVPDAPFDVTLGSGGTFPPAGRPRVLGSASATAPTRWCACTHGWRRRWLASGSRIAMARSRRT